jgi:hypothetical protein
MGKWGNGRMGEWENGEMGEWENGEMGKWGNGEMGECLFYFFLPLRIAVAIEVLSMYSISVVCFINSLVSG